MPYLVAASPIIGNLTLTAANTEYSYECPNGTTHYDLQCRTGATMRFSYEPGHVATPTAPYATLKGGYTFESPALWGSQTLILYLASPTAGAVAEIISWT